MKKRNKKGFTLAELLIVVAIIGVLVAIAIPVFTSKLDAAKLNTDKANLRSAYSQAVSDYMTDGTAPATVEIAGVTYKVTTGTTADDISVEFSTADGQQCKTTDAVKGYGKNGFVDGKIS